MPEWNSNNCVFCVPFASWANGNGLKDKFAGVAPSYPNGAGQAVDFIGMAAGSGYIASRGYCEFDGVDDRLVSNYSLSLTNDSQLTVECWVVDITGTGNMPRWRIIVNATNYLRCYSTGGPINVNYEIGGANIQVQIATSAMAGTLQHIVHVKDGATLRLYHQGVENAGLGYVVQNNYNLGNYTFTGAGWWPGVSNANNGAAVYGDVRVYWFAVYDTVLTAARIAENYSLGPTMSMLGHSEGSTMRLYPKRDLPSKLSTGISI